MAEQLAGDEVACERAAVERDQRARSDRRPGVRPGDRPRLDADIAGPGGADTAMPRDEPVSLRACRRIEDADDRAPRTTRLPGTGRLIRRRRRLGARLLRHRAIVLSPR